MVSPSVRDGAEAVDLDEVARLLGERAQVELAGPLQLRLLSGGRSNLTFLLSDGASEWILRRPPLGHVLATAHDMAREARVQRALHGVGFPVPHIVLAVDDPPLYVMQRVTGTVLRSDADLAAVPPHHRPALSEVYVDTLATLHGIDPGAAGLADFGRPDGFATRQLARWGKQLAASRSRDLPGFDLLAAGLAAEVPAPQRATVVHGDFRLDNVILGLDGVPELRAVLDWEMSTVGDPLTDLGLLYLFWSGWRGIANPIAGTPSAHPGYPSWPELARRYARQTGLQLDDIRWYQAFACFKLAVILEGIHYRHRHGLTVGAGFTRIGEMVEPLVDRGLELLRGGSDGLQL